MKRIFLTLSTVSLFVLTSCGGQAETKNENNTEQEAKELMEEMDKASEEVSDAIEDATESVQDTVSNAAESVEESVEDMTDSI